MRTAFATCLLLLAINLCCGSVYNSTTKAGGKLKNWAWSWDTVPLWADFGSPYLLSEAEMQFLAKTYQIISLGACFGGAQFPDYTEWVIYTTAKRLKEINPNLKVSC